MSMQRKDGCVICTICGYSRLDNSDPYPLEEHSCINVLVNKNKELTSMTTLMSIQLNSYERLFTQATEAIQHNGDLELQIKHFNQPIMCKSCGNKKTFVYLNEKGELPNG